ncbi:MAG: heme biosynthesis protein HemY [Rhodothermaeota bacterium MED-G19]|nr:MAG: heme biosynthesis protein HemY [Rhodothermaeota bacterium MED-G19]
MRYLFLFLIIISPFSCNDNINEVTVISVPEYKEKLKGFWLGQCIANMTGLVTEMDKIGNIGNIKTGRFYTSDDWGKLDEPSIFSPNKPSELSKTIDFVFEQDGIWPADDDTDLEYMYQDLLLKNKTSFLSPSQIKSGWITHIKLKEENFLWVSNQKAFDLMNDGILPPETSDPKLNEHYEMIDAQLTTEIFGILSPGRPDIALEMAQLPILTTARYNAKWISDFYVSMYSLATTLDSNIDIKKNIFSIAEKSRHLLPDASYSSKMYDYVKIQYEKGMSWEDARDNVYERYQVKSEDGYNITSKNLYCNGCFAAGINFAASLISLFWGEGDLKKTIKIGTLAGWDSDNPTSTWGGLIGFIIGKKGIEKEFNRNFSEKYFIHRTRQNFDRDIDDFENMANNGIKVITRMIENDINGRYDRKNQLWYIPNKN